MKSNPYEGMTTEEILAAMPPWKEDAERIRALGLECPKTAVEAQALLKRMEPFPKAEVGGASIDRQRKVLAEAQRRLIAEEKRWLKEAKESNQAWIRERKRMGEYHAGMKQAHMEAEYWAKESGRTRGNYDPIKLFVDEIRRNGDD